MSIEQIPSDKLVKMTLIFHRAFNSFGCNPICHCCVSHIKVGDKFKLATVDTYSEKSANSGISRYETTDTREVMLCENCTVDSMNKMSATRKAEYEKFSKKGGGCYRINGKIIH